jgi:hypothetical protein
MRFFLLSHIEAGSGRSDGDAAGRHGERACRVLSLATLNKGLAILEDKIALAGREADLDGGLGIEIEPRAIVELDRALLAGDECGTPRPVGAKKADARKYNRNQ